MAVVYCSTAEAALVGVWLNIRKCVACFWIWAVTNAVWAVADYTHGLVQQAVVQAVYFVLSIYGIVRWAQDRRRTGDVGEIAR